MRQELCDGLAGVHWAGQAGSAGDAGEEEEEAAGGDGARPPLRRSVTSREQGRRRSLAPADGRWRLSHGQYLPQRDCQNVSYCSGPGQHDEHLQTLGFLHRTNHGAHPRAQGPARPPLPAGSRAQGGPQALPAS